MSEYSRKFIRLKGSAKTDWINRILNVYKPTGISSYDVVRRVKHFLKIRKVGHAGTLDPFAEGVLLILIGQATKQMQRLLTLPKSYEAILDLGEATDTGDNTAPVIRTATIPNITIEKLTEVAKLFSGTIEQIPPAYSAKKINGRPAYKYARQGLKVELKPKKIEIYSLVLDLIDPKTILIKVTCSSGTYIRKLGEDLARALDTEGHLTALKRTSIGNYIWQEAIPFDELGNYLTTAADGVA